MGSVTRFPGVRLERRGATVESLEAELELLQRAISERDPYPELAIRVQDARATLAKIVGQK
jgi:hypothetical protein